MVTQLDLLYNQPNSFNFVINLLIANFRIRAQTKCIPIAKSFLRNTDWSTIPV